MSYDKQKSKPTEKMKKAIKLIEEVTEYSFTGETFEDAKEFLNAHMSELDGVDVRDFRKPTEKQLRACEFIKRSVGEEFVGETMKQCSDFLDEWLPKARAASEESGYHRGRSGYGRR